MRLDVLTFDGDAAGSVDLPDDIFNLEPRADILQRVVRWQLAKRQAGTHKVKNRAEISLTGAKLYKQKGTGRARHGSKRVPQFRKGGRAFGPQVRSHAHDLPKKVRALGLKHALSSKARTNALVVIDGAELQPTVRRAARNIPNVDVLPVQGINVYDILRRDKLVLTRAALDALGARFAKQDEGAAGAANEAGSER